MQKFSTTHVYRTAKEKKVEKLSSPDLSGDVFQYKYLYATMNLNRICSNNTTTNTSTLSRFTKHMII